MAFITNFVSYLFQVFFFGTAIAIQLSSNGTLPTSTRENRNSTATATGISVELGRTSFPTGNINPEATLTPNSPTHPTVSFLITHLRRQVLADYDRYTAVFCFHEGRTLNCDKNWLFPHTWNKASMENNLVANTHTKASYQCSQDRTYLTDTRRVFYGFARENVTDALSGIAHMAAMYAAGSCLLDPTCTGMYNNDTDQMYLDYRHYINSTFLEYLVTELEKDPKISYCPARILSIASVFEWLTTTFDGSREYFGFHNAMFLPGVMDKLDAEEQMARIQAQSYFANNARRVEGVFLNMVFFTHERNSGRRRDEWDEDADLVKMFPGCTRREWIAKGKCEGVIPPRTFDMDGSVVSMEDRDKGETLAMLSHPLANTGLVPRQTTCSRISSLNSQLLAFRTAIALYNTVSIVVATVNIAETAILADVLLIEAAPLIAALGIIYFAGAMAVNYCDVFSACNGMPDVLVSAVKIFTAQTAGGKLGNTKYPLFPVANSMKPLARYSSLFSTAAAFGLLQVAENYYEKALGCCQTNCDGAICMQTSLGCIRAFSSSATLDCAAE